MSSQTSTLKSTIDPYAQLQLILNSDGSITRNPSRFPITALSPDPDTTSTPILAKDVFINQSNKTWSRIFLPRYAPDPLPTKKLPLVVYFHGGGFIYCSAASTVFHNFCANLAIELRVAVISVDYRLCPEHRLPALYNDAMEALYWIKTSSEDWLVKHVDLSNSFIMGSSAGANIAYNAGLRAAGEVDYLEPLKIRGVILHQPFIGGIQRSESELRMINDRVLALSVTDLIWELSLPIGVDRDHEYCNPTVGGGSKIMDQIKRLEWKFLVVGCDGDPLIDRQISLVKLMEAKGIQVVGHFGVGGFHGVEVNDPKNPKVKELHEAVKNIIFA